MTLSEETQWARISRDHSVLRKLSKGEIAVGIHMNHQEQQSRLARLRECESLAEDSYRQLYEPRTHNNPAAHYSDAKEFLHEAIEIARELGMEDEAERLAKRLQHIKEVFRSQFG